MKVQGKCVSKGDCVSSRHYAAVNLALVCLWYPAVVTNARLCDTQSTLAKIWLPSAAQSSRLDNERGSCVSLNASRVNCTDLQSAIDWTVNASGVLSTDDEYLCTEIHLPDGVHEITHPTDLQNTSLHLIGAPGNAISMTVKCSYFADPSLNRSREIHTWYFDRANSVAFENIHFVQCGFPFRLDSVRNFYVNNCTFR